MSLTLTDADTRAIRSGLESVNEKLERLITQAGIITGLDLKPGEK